MGNPKKIATVLFIIYLTKSTSHLCYMFDLSDLATPTYEAASFAAKEIMLVEGLFFFF